MDSLDYLIPPVRKPYGVTESELLYNRHFKKQQGFKLINNFQNKFTQRIIRSPSTHGSDAITSTSVILKKTTRELIHEQYSILNSNSKTYQTKKHILPEKELRKNTKIEDKPTIKVIIIPKSAEIQPSKVFNKCREKTKIQTSVSNQESSIKNQNVYFIAKGKRREKVYEIKSTGRRNLSTQFVNKKYDNISLHQIINSKPLINSLNMEKFKRKNNKFAPCSKGNIDGAYQNINSNPKINSFGGTYHNINSYEEPDDINGRKRSKVTIVGQLGLTRDDQYVLKCAATVNDKPIATNYIQPDNNTTNENLLNTIRNAQKNVSQATQVNFNQQRHKGLENKITQCNYDYSNTENNPYNVIGQNNVLKESQNPLIIISVYPRHEKVDDSNSLVKVFHQPNKSKKIANNIDCSKLKARTAQVRKNNTVNIDKTEQKSPHRSRSPSPVIKTVRNKILDKTINGTVIKSDKTNGVNLQCAQTNVREMSEIKSKHRVNHFNKKDAGCYCPYSIELGKQTLELNTKLGDSKGTDSKQVKQALVNNFLRSVGRSEQTDAKMAPKTDTSRLTININSGNERYDVLVEQSNFNSGFLISNPLKTQPHARGTADEIGINSMENFLMLSKNNKNTQDISKDVPKRSRLKIKDSLEISRSREERAVSRTNSSNMKDKHDFRNSNSKGPVKHFRGDNCLLPDPNERDKEIRELLGIEKNPRNLKKGVHDATKENKFLYCYSGNQQNGKEYCCRKKCSKGIITANSISKVTKKCSRRTISKNQMSRLSLRRREAYKIDKMEFQRLENKIEVCKKATANSSGALEKLSVDINDNFKHINRDDFHKEPYLDQNLVLNRNVQLFLQLEQFTKQKPIILTRKQYEKIKKTIQGSMKQHKRHTSEFSIVSLCKINAKPKLRQISYDREVQTELSEIKKTDKCKEVLAQYKHKTQKINTHNTKPKTCNHKQADKFSITHRNNSNIKDTSEKYVEHDTPKIKIKRNNNKSVIENNLIPHSVSLRQTVSSMEIHYANVTLTKDIAISSTHFGDGLHNKINTGDIPKPSTSIHTIFKGHRKSATPNLGTSVYSLFSDWNDSAKSIKAYAGDAKPRKPFLQRLISCLVMRSTETTVFKKVPEKRMPTVNSSVDSYHISTSLGALEMTSTLYDTSASFFSNHTIAPTNKMKRSFLSSVREFLTSRKS